MRLSGRTSSFDRPFRGGFWYNLPHEKNTVSRRGDSRGFVVFFRRRGTVAFRGRIEGPDDREQLFDKLYAAASAGRQGERTQARPRLTTGGAVYPVDIATGRIEGPGGNNVVGPTIYVHPGTNCFMPGRIIPFWHEAIETVSTAAAMIPNIRLVGWDVAILENGPELIEGNSKPGTGHTRG